MIQPLEFKREYIHNNPSSTNQNTTLETMSIVIRTAHHCDDTDDIEVTICYHY